jgi:uridine kinase
MAAGMRYVVGIAGAAGAGKTSLVQALVGSMPDALALHIDAYQQFTQQPMDELVRWVERGGDVDEFSIPALAEHIDKLKRGEPVRDPVHGRELAPRKYILLETHFGRAHRATGRYIDLLVWLDTPLDLALARNVRKFLIPLTQDCDARAARDAATWIRTYLENYMAHVRRLVRAQQEMVSADADLVVDGTSTIADIAARVRGFISERLP